MKVYTAIVSTIYKDARRRIQFSTTHLHLDGKNVGGLVTVQIIRAFVGNGYAGHLKCAGSRDAIWTFEEIVGKYVRMMLVAYKVNF